MCPSCSRLVVPCAKNYIVLVGPERIEDGWSTYWNSEPKFYNLVERVGPARTIEFLPVLSTEIVSIFVGHGHALSSVVIKCRSLWMTMAHVHAWTLRSETTAI